MDDVLRCSGCGLVIGLGDDVTNVAGRRFHRMCVDAARHDGAGRRSRWVERFRGLRGWAGFSQRNGA